MLHKSGAAKICPGGGNLGGLVMKSIAYLGMGIMGSSMACNLAKAGFRVTVWNRSEGREGLRRAQEAGARKAASIAEAVADADVVMSCLSDVPDIEMVLLGDGGVSSSAKAGAIVVDMATTGPACAQMVAGKFADKGMQFLDAPVSGGDVGARNATLTIMVGGERTAFDACLPIFQSIGKNIHYCGSAGAGQSVKLCNQILCAVNMLAVCESLELAKSMGIDPTLMIDVCGSGAAGSWALSNLGPRIAKGDLEPGFMIKDMQKDLRLIREAAQNVEHGLSLPACQLAVKQFGEAVQLIGNQGDRKGTQAMSVAYGR
jgi:3-hydroxyisobutyrate dehydrogenase